MTTSTKPAQILTVKRRPVSSHPRQNTSFRPPPSPRPSMQHVRAVRTRCRTSPRRRAISHRTFVRPTRQTGKRVVLWPARSYARTPLHASRCSHIVAVIAIQALWDTLLDARIQLHKAVTAANRLPVVSSTFTRCRTLPGLESTSVAPRDKQLCLTPINARGSREHA